MSVPSSLSQHAPHLRIIPAGEMLWRIHSTTGSFPIGWNEIRTFGPLATARWDPHPEPTAIHAPLGAAYLGLDLLTCIAEVYQEFRVVTVDRGQYLTGIRTPRELNLIDLTTEWFVRIGGTSGSVGVAGLSVKNTSRAWARLIHRTWPQYDGIIAPSAVVPGREVVMVWTDAVFPESPSFSEPLSSLAIRAGIEDLAEQIGYQIDF